MSEESNITSLLQIITTGVAALQQVSQSHNTSLPSLSQPFHPASEAFRADPVAAESAGLVVAAALQLVATLAPPMEGLYGNAVAGGLKAAALRVCHESNVTEILREAGPQGLPVTDIAQKNGLEAKKLARLLRFLANQHIYEEVQPEVFRNNRLSSLLDSGKPSADVIASPETKHDGAIGPGALIAHHLDEVTHSAAYTWENLSSPKTGHSYAASHCPLSNYIGKEATIWEYYAEPGQETRHKRFDLAMKAVGQLQPPEAVYDGLDWDKLPKGATVVDVGGGLGTYMVPLAEKFGASLNIIVQDLPKTIGRAQEFWKETNAQAITEKRVSLEAQSFFDPQPTRPVDIFLLKSIIHDWADPDCVKILSNLRNAATKDKTRLVLVESVVPLACRSQSNSNSDDSSEAQKPVVPGSVLKEAPEPLLPSCLRAPLMSAADMVMMMAAGGQERTFDHMQELLLSTGWKVDEVRHPKSQHVLYSFYVASAV